MQYNTQSYQSLFKTVLEDTGVPHPAVLKKPPPRPEDDVYYDAFCILGGRRLYSQVGPQPIPYSEIVVFMNEMRVTDLDDRELFTSLVTFLDNVELNYLTSKLK